MTIHTLSIQRSIALLAIALALTGTAASTSAKTTLTPASGSHSHVALVGVCHEPDRDARITRLALPGFPWSAEFNTATTIVAIDLSASGELVWSRIATSSGNPLFDREALLSARYSSYAPAVQNCSRVGGAYLFKVDFE